MSKNRNRALATLPASIQVIELTPENVAEVHNVIAEAVGEAPLNGEVLAPETNNDGQTVEEEISNVGRTEEASAVMALAPEAPTQVEDLSYEALLLRLKTKSAVIRYLASIGWERARIAKHMGILYQHVRNVLTKPVGPQNQA